VGARSKALEIIDLECGATTLYEEGFPAIVYPALSPDGVRLAVGLGNEIRICKLT
jgi:hypothetical protein